MDIRRLIAEELHATARRNFPTRRVVLKGLNDLFQLDLADLQLYAKQNKGFKYVLFIIDCFTKFLITIPLKSKSSENVSAALAPILARYKMKHIQTDDGKEFYNKKVNKLIDNYGINHYSTYSSKKASIVERVIRTIKSKLWTAFTARGSYTWIDILDEIVRKYNNTVHRSTRMKPVDIKQAHVKAVLKRLTAAATGQSQRVAKFSIGDKVRISKYKHVFKKGYLPNWTNETFSIFKVNPTIPPTYILNDNKGNVLKGAFYEQELLRTKVGDVYLVEKILRKRGNRVLVRWKGFDKSADSWINESDLV